MTQIIVKQVTKALEFVWISYKAAHMLTGSLPENNHPKSYHIVRLGNNSTSLNRNVVLVTFNGLFFVIKANFGKMCMPNLFQFIVQ